MTATGTRTARPAGRGAAGAVERAWSGAPGSVPWTLALAPFAGLYALGAAAARRRAEALRRAVPGLYVLAIGGLTVGGTGKTALARWLAREAAAAGGRGAVLLRGHGRSIEGEDRTAVIPDAPGYPLAEAARRYGDEAAAHRAALPLAIAVAVDRDRLRAARVARDGYGATVAVLDDGWEQPRLAWDSLWVALDPERPDGNGWAIPAGPLRRPRRTLAEADVVAFVLESPGDRVPEATLAMVRRRAPRAQVIRFRRVLAGVAVPGPRGAGEPPAPAGGRRAALLTAVGAPERVTRFAEGAGFRVVAHEAFPDHARVGPERLRAALERAAARGASVALVTEKDEHRWTLPGDAPIPWRVLRTEIEPLDPVDPPLARFRAAARAERPSRP